MCLVLLGPTVINAQNTSFYQRPKTFDTEVSHHRIPYRGLRAGDDSSSPFHSSIHLNC